VGSASLSPDSTKWAYDIGTDWGNAQLEYDTDRPEMYLWMVLETLLLPPVGSYMGCAFSSGKNKTQGLLSKLTADLRQVLKCPGSWNMAGFLVIRFWCGNSRLASMW